MLKVSILILSYNTKDLLKKCLSSIYKHLPYSSFEIIVVDNASEDGSVAMLKKEFPHVVLIESKENLGFAKGMNVAAKKAKGEYLFLFNSDAELQDDRLLKMVEFLSQEKNAAIVGGQLIDSDGKLQRSFSHFYTLPHVFKMLLLGDKGEIVQHEKDFQVDWVSGGCLLMKSTVFERVQGFDEEFFMYMEDMELCYKVAKMGYNVYAFPQMKAIHVNQGSSNRSFAVIHIYKGLRYFYRKHRYLWERVLLEILLVSKALIVIALGYIVRNKNLVKTYKSALVA